MHSCFRSAIVEDKVDELISAPRGAISRSVFDKRPRNHCVLSEREGFTGAIGDLVNES
jgi:hypothetical protein